MTPPLMMPRRLLTPPRTVSPSHAFMSRFPSVEGASSGGNRDMHQKGTAWI